MIWTALNLPLNTNLLPAPTPIILNSSVNLILSFFYSLPPGAVKKIKAFSYFKKSYCLPLTNYNSKDKYRMSFAEPIIKSYEYDVYEKLICRNTNGIWIDINYRTIIKNKYNKSCF